MGKSVIRAAAAALVLSVAFNTADAAGLGRLTVLSSLGQPFRGEVDLVAVKKDELASLTARIASPDAFRQADLPFTAYISNLKLSIEKRPNGDPYVKVTAAQPLNEPFIDFLVEVNWTSGRLVRAYTALLDPPAVTETAAETPPVVAAAQVEPPVAQPAPRVEPPADPQARASAEVARAPEPEPRAEPVPAPPRPEPEPAPRAEAPAVTAPEASTGMTGSSPLPAEHKVRRGDTLGKIARANKPADLSLEQMLVLLYRNNPDAFDGKNMNRLRTGRVLRMPEASEAEAITPAEARKEVRVQAANWNAYREKLSAFAAATPVAEDAGAQSASGKITSKVEEKVPSLTEAPKEVLKLSKGEPAKDAKSLERVRNLEEEVAAKSKAASEASSRVGQLEKQIKDMQALVELKSKSMADTQKPAEPPKSAAAPLPIPAPAKSEPIAPAKPSKPGEAPSLVPPAADTAAPKADTAPVPDLSLPKPDAAPDATTPPVGTPIEPPIEPPKPVVKRKPFVPPPPPPPPSLLDQILGEPLYLAGGAAIAAALGGLGFLGWKRRRAAAAAPHDEAVLSPIEDFVPAAAATIPGGTPIATQEVTERASEGVDGSDPLAEADVFLIYGRDAQAEERLKEAIAAQPMRYELHAKLLEIYAKRGDALAFEAIAKDIQIGTGAQGEHWEKAVRLGYELDPGNPRYAAGRPQGEPTERTFPGSDQTVQMPAFGEDNKTDLDFNLGFDEGPSSSSTDIDLGELGQTLSRESATRTDIDLDDLGGPSDFGEVLDPTKTIGGSPADAERVSTMQMEAFDPTATLAAPETGDLPTLPGIPSGPAAAVADDLGLDFDLGDAEPTNVPSISAAGSSALDDISFDLNTLQLDAPPLETAAAAAESVPSGPPDFDLSGISLDLGDSGTAPAGKDEKWYDVQTKFDLAKAYQEMGDAEGAREILQEVLAEGDAEQKSAAESLLASLG